MIGNGQKLVAAVYLVVCVMCGGLLVSCVKKPTLLTNCKLPKADGRSDISITGFPRYSSRLPTTGTVSVTILMVDFPDSAATMPIATAYAKISGAKQFFSDMSYGRLNYNMSQPAGGWIRMPNASTQYNFDSGAAHFAYAEDAVAAADSAVDFSSTQSLVIIQNPDTTTVSEIGPSMPLSAGYGITADGNEMNNIVTSGNDLNQHGYLWLNHEVSHTMGLVDLYASTPPLNTFADSLRYTGGFGLMGVSSLAYLHAPSYTAWERWVLSWLDDSQVQCSNPDIDGEITATLTPINTVGGQKAIVVPVGETKVLVVESRRATGIDSNLAKEGALVYTVDSSLQSGLGPLKVYPAGGDTWFSNSPRAAGESVVVDGIKVEVITSTVSGDTVRISSSGVHVKP